MKTKPTKQGKKNCESYCLIGNRYSEYIKTESNQSIQLKGVRDKKNKHTMSLVTREIKIKSTKLFQFICIENYKNKTKQKIPMFDIKKLEH